MLRSPLIVLLHGRRRATIGAVGVARWRSSAGGQTDLVGCKASVAVRPGRRRKEEDKPADTNTTDSAPKYRERHPCPRCLLLQLQLFLPLLVVNREDRILATGRYLRIVWQQLQGQGEPWTSAQPLQRQRRLRLRRRWPSRWKSLGINNTSCKLGVLYQVARVFGGGYRIPGKIPGGSILAEDKAAVLCGTPMCFCTDRVRVLCP